MRDAGSGETRDGKTFNLPPPPAQLNPVGEKLADNAGKFESVTGKSACQQNVCMLGMPINNKMFVRRMLVLADGAAQQPARRSWKESVERSSQIFLILRGGPERRKLLAGLPFSAGVVAADFDSGASNARKAVVASRLVSERKSGESVRVVRSRPRLKRRRLCARRESAGGRTAPASGTMPRRSRSRCSPHIRPCPYARSRTRRTARCA